jgi:hypothetical protein
MRGLYGQAEGNESRQQAAVIGDIIRENEIAEGEWERLMVNAAKKGNLKQMATYRDNMKREAVQWGCDSHKAQDRADATLTRAMRQLRLK